MSRTTHLTQRQAFGLDPKPHRQQPTSKLTHTPDWLPAVPRPKNLGTKRTPSGGYAAARKDRALVKKLGKRRMRRMGWQQP